MSYNDKYVEYKVEKKGISKSKVLKLLRDNPDKNVVIVFDNTAKLNEKIINSIKLINEKLLIKIIGAFSEERINYFKEREEYLKENNIYTLDETKEIIKKINLLEKGINSKWDDFEKLIYLIGELNKYIVYHQEYDIATSKEMSCLKGMIYQKTNSSGYAVIVKELCDRNNIICDYVEGSTKKDIDKIDHTWNIVNINGMNIPLDLTSTNNYGKAIDLSCLTNLNLFVKTHFPSKFEKLQDYSTLKCINGTYLKSLSDIINKDSYHDNNTKIRTRKDGLKYSITSIDQIEVFNELIYKYILMQEKDGYLKDPVIIFTKTNFINLISEIEDKERLIKELEKTEKLDDLDQIIILRNKLEYIKEVEYALDNIYFSKENINESIKRKDYYLGEIVTEVKDNIYKYKGIEISPNFINKENTYQKTFKRNNNTTFVLEKDGIIDTPYGKVNRYKIYEKESRKGVIKESIIFSEQDLFIEDSNLFINHYLSREIIEEQLIKSSGYLGSFKKNGKIVLNPKLVYYFKKGIYEDLKLNDEKVIDYNEEITFSLIQRLVNTYYLKQGKIHNKYTDRLVNDKNLELKIKFAYIYLEASKINETKENLMNDIKHIYNDESKKIFDFISNIINESIIKMGYLDIVDILYQVTEKSTYKYAPDIVINMFKDKNSVDIINEVFKSINPSRLHQNNELKFFGNNPYLTAYKMLEKKREEIKRIEKQTLEVSEVDQVIEIVTKGRI